MVWACVEGVNENGAYEVWYTEAYGEKVLSIEVVYESKVQAILEARILSFEKGEEPETEYSCKNVFMDFEVNELRKKINNEIFYFNIR